ncbi:MAG: hypothetical protein ACI97A_000948 [Planctomycetota bacterium]|jgi:hypothetical protein
MSSPESEANSTEPQAGMLAVRSMKVLVGIVLAFMVLEIFTRLILPAGNWTPGQGLSSAAYYLGQDGILLTKPNLRTATCVNLSPWTPLFTNEHGFRVPAVVPSVPEEPHEKIVILGASNTWGMGVAAEETWPMLLQGMLKNKGKAVHVMNAAQVGYTLPHMFRRAEQLAEQIDVGRILIAVPSSGLYMFGLGSEASPWDFVNFHPWQVAPLPLHYAFADLPELEMKNGFVLQKDRAFRDSLVDDARTQSALGHRIWAKSMLRYRRFDVVKQEKDIDLAKLKQSVTKLGEEFCRLEDKLAKRKIGLHIVFFPAQWGDLVLANDAIQNQILGAFQRVARVGLRRYPRADLTADPKYRVDLDVNPGADLLIDARHLSPQGHHKVATAVARWYVDKKLGVK